MSDQEPRLKSRFSREIWPGEDPIGTRIQRVERAIVGAPMEVTRTARRLAVAADLHVPEERLAQTNCRRLVDDVATDRSGDRNVRERTHIATVTNCDMSVR